MSMGSPLTGKRMKAKVAFQVDAGHDASVLWVDLFVLAGTAERER